MVSFKWRARFPRACISRRLPLPFSIRGAAGNNRGAAGETSPPVRTQGRTAYLSCFVVFRPDASVQAAQQVIVTFSVETFKIDYSSVNTHISQNYKELHRTGALRMRLHESSAFHIRKRTLNSGQRFCVFQWWWRLDSSKTHPISWPLFPSAI